MRRADTTGQPASGDSGLSAEWWRACPYRFSTSLLELRGACSRGADSFRHSLLRLSFDDARRLDDISELLEDYNNTARKTLSALRLC